jgi:hypothetical protein
MSCLPLRVSRAYLPRKSRGWGVRPLARVVEQAKFNQVVAGTDPQMLDVFAAFVHSPSPGSPAKARAAAATTKRDQKLHCTDEMVTQTQYLEYKKICNACAEKSEAIIEAAHISFSHMADESHRRSQQTQGVPT